MPPSAYWPIRSSCEWLARGFPDHRVLALDIVDARYDPGRIETQQALIPLIQGGAQQAGLGGVPGDEAVLGGVLVKVLQAVKRI